MGVSLTSCGSDWLEIEPNTQETIEVYYTKDAAIQEAVVAAYDPLHWFDYGNNYSGLNVVPEMLGDMVYPGGGDAGDQPWQKNLYNFTATPSSMNDATIYSNAYSGVKRCNDALHYMHDYDVKDMTEANRDYYDAQVRALRAFYYNVLWHWWGNIPYYEKNLSGDFLAEQLPADQVYEKVVAELESLIDGNKLKWKSSTAEQGRMTMPFVYMLYTEMVMYQNDQTRYAKALELMKKIIDSPDYSLNPDFAAIWALDGEWCDESIYEINYSDYLGARNWSWGGTAGGTVVPAYVGARGYSGGDGIHDNTGWGFCTVRQSAYDKYDAADVRRDVSIWTPEAGSYQVGYQDTGHFIGKYAPVAGGNAGQIADAPLNYNNNLRLYRYSEVLLNAAELVARDAGAGDAQGWLDQVRQRAGLGSIAPTVDNIIEERALEFLGEGKRYWDIIRSGKAAELLVPDNEIPDGRKGTWSDNKKYFPFSQSEMDQTYGTLTQNPY